MRAQANVETTELSNGLRVACVPVLGTSFVELVLAARVGSRYEEARLGGISHFTEHMLFRGSRKFPNTFSLNCALETLGNGLEAGTTREFTLFSIQVLPENLHPTLKILQDLFSDPLFEGIETEKGIVFEEMLEELDEDGEDSDLDNLSRKLLFGDHSLGRPVLGRKESLNAIQNKDLLDYFKRAYSPSNLVLVAAGNIEPQTLLASVKETLGHCPRGPRFEDPSPATPAMDAGPRLLHRKKPGSAQVEVLLSFLAQGEGSAGYFPQMAIERLLDDGLSSRLQRSLCENKGLLYDISVSFDGYTDVGILDVSFRIAEKRVNLALEEILRELKRLKVEPVGDEELSRLKARLHREVLALFESPRYVASRVAETLVLGTAVPVRFEEWRRNIELLAPDQIQAAALEVFRPEGMVAVLEGKITKQEFSLVEKNLKYLL